jgi:hypothetical protein
MTDAYDTAWAGPEAPIQSAAAVTPNDGADLAVTSRALHIGGAGDLKVTLKSGVVVTFTAMGAGWHPIRVARVWATGTTATGIVAGW